MSSPGTPLPNEENDLAVLNQSVGITLKRLDDAIGLSLKLVNRAGGAKYSSWRSAKTGVVVLALYSKSITTARSIRLLASRGFLAEGFTLCRSLLETDIAVHYLLQARGQKRANEYLANVLAQIEKTANSWCETKGLKRHGRALRKQVQEALQKEFPKISPARLDLLRRKGYSGKTIHDTCRFLGRLKDYHILYRMMSPHAHTASLETHIALGEGKAVDLRLGSTDAQEVRRLVKYAILGLCMVMKRVSEVMSFGYLADIAKLSASTDGNVHALMKSWTKHARDRGRV
jgi:Family of unknown function (DUF5677)